MIDAVAAVDLGCTRRTNRAAGLRRTYLAMTLHWEVTSVAQAHAIGDASLGTGRFGAGQRRRRIRITVDGGIPQAAEERFENVLCRGRSHGGEKRRGGDAGHEQALDAAAQAGLAMVQQSKGLPRVARRRPHARHRSVSSAAGGNMT